MASPRTGAVSRVRAVAFASALSTLAACASVLGLDDYAIDSPAALDAGNAAPAPDPAVPPESAAPDAGPTDARADGDGDADAPVQRTCDAGERPAFDSCYFVASTRRRQDQAAEACVAAGGHLVTLGSAAEDAFVERMLDGGTIWIGLVAPGPAATGDDAAAFRWVTGEPVAFLRFGPTEPNNGQRCVVQGPSNDGLATPGWYTRACGDDHAFVCERP